MKLQRRQAFCARPLAERETARVNVHLGDADEPQGGREAESWGDGTLERQVRQLVPLLQAEGGVVEHAAVQVTSLLYLQLVDVAPEPHELPRQLLVLQAHVGLMERDGTDRRSNHLLGHQNVSFNHISWPHSVTERRLSGQSASISDRLAPQPMQSGRQSALGQGTEPPKCSHWCLNVNGLLAPTLDMTSTRT